MPARSSTNYGLAQVSDEGLIGDTIEKVLSANDDMVQRFLAGNDKVINAIFGRIMGELRGKGDPDSRPADSYRKDSKA